MNRFVPLAVTAALVVAAVVVLLSGCGDSSTPDKIVVSRSTLDAIGTSAFTSDVVISFAESELVVTFDGYYQPPDRLQGLLEVTGETLGFLTNVEIFVIGNEAWTRESEGSWERADFYSFTALLSPWFYVEALEFEMLSLSPAGSVETVNGVEAYPLEFDKDAILDLLPQATEFTFDPDTMERTIDNAAGWLPDDFELKAWIAVDGSYPVRLEIEMSGGSDGLFGLIKDAERLEFRIDVTDINVDLDLQRPSSIPTASPTTTSTATPTPSGELTQFQRARITEIVSRDPRAKEIVTGGSIRLAHEAWHTVELRILGGYTYVRFINPRSYEGSLPSIIYDETETTDPPFIEVERDVNLEGIKRLRVLVYLPEERVVQIEVVEAQ